MPSKEISYTYLCNRFCDFGQLFVTYALLYIPNILYIGTDFTHMPFNITMPEDTSVFEILSERVRVIDDNTTETEQAFALIAQLGDDVPDRFVCFKRRINDSECLGTTGAIEIEIVDNDGKFCIDIT